MADLEHASVSDDIEEEWGCGGVGKEGKERVVKEDRVWDDGRVLLEKEDNGVAKR